MVEAHRTEPKRCAGVRKDGQPCQAPAVAVSGYCYAHDPSRSGERADTRRRGGHNSSAQARLRGLVPPRLIAVYDALEEALEQVHAGTLVPAKAQAMASLARAMVGVLQAGEVEERLRDLERQVESQGDGDG
jgi:hypothetical protein